jgi:hypothetical protein
MVIFHKLNLISWLASTSVSSNRLYIDNSLLTGRLLITFNMLNPELYKCSIIYILMTPMKDFTEYILCTTQA